MKSWRGARPQSSGTSSEGGDVMLDNHWALVEAALLIAACGVVGAILGGIVIMLRKDGRDGG